MKYYTRFGPRDSGLQDFVQEMGDPGTLLIGSGALPPQGVPGHGPRDSQARRRASDVDSRARARGQAKMALRWQQQQEEAAKAQNDGADMYPPPFMDPPSRSKYTKVIIVR